jgi:uncharacterized protein YuzE
MAMSADAEHDVYVYLDTSKSVERTHNIEDDLNLDYAEDRLLGVEVLGAVDVTIDGMAVLAELDRLRAKLASAKETIEVLADSEMMRALREAEEEVAGGLRTEIDRLRAVNIQRIVVDFYDAHGNSVCRHEQDARYGETYDFPDGATGVAVMPVTRGLDAPRNPEDRS